MVGRFCLIPAPATRTRRRRRGSVMGRASRAQGAGRRSRSPAPRKSGAGGYFRSSSRAPKEGDGARLHRESTPLPRTAESTDARPAERSCSVPRRNTNRARAGLPERSARRSWAKSRSPTEADGTQRSACDTRNHPSPGKALSERCSIPSPTRKRPDGWPEGLAFWLC